MTQPALYPLVCIEHQQQRLYAELIQIVEARQIAWLRPWAMVDWGNEEARGNENAGEPVWATLNNPNHGRCLDLRQAPDLLLPRRLLRPALDTEWLAVLSQLSPVSPDKPLPAWERQSLHQLLRQLCQAPPPEPQEPASADIGTSAKVNS
jgi:hypothetical protein